MADIQSAAAAEGYARMKTQYISSYYTTIISNRLASGGDNTDTIAIVSIGCLIF